ncbi:MAG TPA: flagellar hook capping FlgD N-terminal domain-containing protein [Chloroflexota bacterium]|nr:flagellar hook capping FlgD N-terminal domain-containing protein [Chloroflexota bacterium]
MTVSATNCTPASTSATGTKSTSKTGSQIGAAAGMGKDDFMQLLIAQLKNQDPMKPMEDKEFITQLAQFSSLEAMEKMTDQMEELTSSQMLVQAATLIGKQVTAKLENGEVVTGTISQVKMISGQPTAVVNGKEIDTSLITQIG